MASLLLNHSFETGSIDNWTKGGDISEVQKSSSYAFDGTYACKFVNPSSSYSARQILSDQVLASPGVEYTLSAWFYIKGNTPGFPSSSTATHIRMRMVFYDSSHVLLGYGYYDMSYPFNGWTNIDVWDTWIHQSFSFTSPAGTNYISAIIEAREEDNPSPPPSGQPNNDVYVDLVELVAGYETIEDTFRIYGIVVTATYTEDTNRIYSKGVTSGTHSPIVRIKGAVAGPFTDEFRIVGTVFNDTYNTTFRILGAVERIVLWADTPSRDYKREEDTLCNYPDTAVLLFHEDLPDNPVPGPGGALKYVDITDRTMDPGNIYREMSSKPGDAPNLVVSDVTLSVDNSDGYFSYRNSTSPFYNTQYVGFNFNNRIELWTGFKYDIYIERICKAKMVIVNVKTASADGKASISCRDYLSAALDTEIGYTDPDTSEELPLEYPSYAVTAGVNDLMYFATEHSWPAYIPVTIPAGLWGSLSLAYWLEKVLNASALLNNPGGPNEISWTVEYDEVTRLFTITDSGGTTVYRLEKTMSTAELLYGFTGAGFVTSNADDEIISNVAQTATSTFKEIMEDLLEVQASIPSALVDIEDVAITFAGATFDHATVADAVNKLAVVGSGSLWTEGSGIIKYRKFSSMPTTITKSLEGDLNYGNCYVRGQDQDLAIKKISLTGKFEGVYAEAESGLDYGEDINLNNSLVETQGVAEGIVAEYINRYNVEPISVEIDSEFLPSLEASDMVSVYESGAPNTPILGQVVKNNLSLSGLNGKLTVIPFTLQKAWSTQADWNSYTLDSGGLYCPHDYEWLQLKLLNITGYRLFDWTVPGGGTANWVGFTSSEDIDNTTIFLDHFDVTPVGRYLLKAAEFEDKTDIGSLYYDAANYRAVIVALNATYPDMACMLMLPDIDTNNISDNVFLWTTFAFTGLATGGDILYKNYFATFLRYSDLDNMNYLFIKCTTGYSTPRIGYEQAGSDHYINNDLHSPNYVYAVLNTEYASNGSVNEAIIQYSISNLVPTLEYANPLPKPGASGRPGYVAAGFCRANGYISAYEIHRQDSAPSSLDYKFWSFCSPGPNWRDHLGNVYPVGGSTAAQVNLLPSGTKIRIKVTGSRATKYHCIPFLKNMTISYQLG